MMNLLRNRKLLLIALVLSLLFVLFFAQSVFAQDIRLSASEETGAVGSTVTVKVSIANALDTEGGQFDLSFGPLLEAVAIRNGDFLPQLTAGENYNLKAGDNKLRVLWVTAAGSSKESGVLCYIDFKIIGEGATELKFSDVLVLDEDTKAATVNTTPGKVTGTGKIDDDDDDDDADDEKADKIKAANDAINNLPEVGKLNCSDWNTVRDARRLVDVAISHGAVDSDFSNLSKLVAAEKWINNNCQVTPRTGGAYFLLLGGLLILIAGVAVILKRRQLLAVK